MNIEFYKQSNYIRIFFMKNMKLLSVPELRERCPLKWGSNIPKNGISLGVADIDFEGPIGVIDYLKGNLKESFNFYQNQSGLKSAINTAEKYLNNKGINCNQENIQVIDGTMMGIYISMKWASRINGDILSLGPIYDPIWRHAEDNGNKIRWLGLKEDGIDEEKLLNIIEEQKIKMITICNPVNPTGYSFREEELKFLADVIYDNELFVFSDELYEPLCFGSEHISMGSFDKIRDRSILLYGFSKAYGLAGYRSGFMHIGPDIENIKYISSQQMVSPSPISSLIINYALNEVDAKKWVTEFREHCKNITEFAFNYFNDSGFKLQKPDSNFFIFPNLKVDDIAFTEFLLKNYGVQVVPGSTFGPDGKNHIRINCGTSEKRLEDAFERIMKALDEFNNVKK